MREMKTKYKSQISSSALHTGSYDEAHVDPHRARRLADLTRDWVEHGATPALVTLAARKGVIFHESAKGTLTSAAESPPIPADAVFPLSSLTKPITATAIMVLVDDGLIDLNDRVSRYVPDLIDTDRVAVHHLLTFTSGYNADEVEAHVKSQGEIPIPEPPEGVDPERFEYLYRRKSAPLSKMPGEEMAYGGHAYELLAEIVRVVACERLSSFARGRIFEPLGMADTHYLRPDALLPRSVDFERQWIDSIGERRSESASSGAVSTVHDMAIFGQMFLNGGAYDESRILSRAAVREMTRNQIPGIDAHYRDEYFPEATWGYGWNMRGTKRQPARGSLHSPDTFFAGGAGGVLLWIDPVYEIAGCFFGVERGRGYVDPDIGESYYYPPALFMNAVTAAAL